MVTPTLSKSTHMLYQIQWPAPSALTRPLCSDTPTLTPAHLGPLGTKQSQDHNSSNTRRTHDVQSSSWVYIHLKSLHPSNTNWPQVTARSQCSVLSPITRACQREQRRLNLMSKINKSFLTAGFSLGADEPEITGGFRRKENNHPETHHSTNTTQPFGACWAHAGLSLASHLSTRVALSLWSKRMEMRLKQAVLQVYFSGGGGGGNQYCTPS